MRIIGNNLNCLPSAHYMQKSRNFIAAINYYNPDAILTQETGLNFYALEEQDTIEERIRHLDQASVSYSHNVHEGTLTTLQ